MTEHSGLPVAGYRSQKDEAIRVVNCNKEIEEKVLRLLDALREDGNATPGAVDQRWLAIGRTQIEQGFMAVNRAVFQPSRVNLPEDAL